MQTQEKLLIKGGSVRIVEASSFEVLLRTQQLRSFSLRKDASSKPQ
jgi:hypothetical protein